MLTREPETLRTAGIMRLMEENHSAPEGSINGQNKRHLVLYGIIGLAGIVLFTLLLANSRPDVSDMPVSATTTLAVIPGQDQIARGERAEEKVQEMSPKEFTFEIVATTRLRQKGLSGRAEVPENYGMIFAFPVKDRYGFWMKDMLVPIDIIWLSDTGDGIGTIAGIEDSVSPATYPSTFVSPEPVRYVLEVRAGEARRQGWSIGTRLTLPTGIPVPQ